jgi:sec-independent protein translocase protein TatC
MANQRRLKILAIDDPDPKEMSIVEHLEELRSRLIVSLMAIAIASVGGWFLFQPALHLLVLPLPTQYHQLVFTTFTGAFTFRLKLSIIIGIMIAIPIWMYELWMFIVPAVEVGVRRYIVPFVLLGMVLFAAGMVMGYKVTPLAIRFMLSLAGQDLKLIPFANEYLNQVGMIMLIFGAVFQLPVILTLLARVGIVSSAALRRKRKFAFFGGLAGSMIITPGADPITPLIVGGAVLLLYEFSIVLIRFIHR